MPELDVREQPMDEATKAIYRRVQESPGGIGATDVILGLQAGGLAEPLLRRAIWLLVSRGSLRVDERRQLVPTAIAAA
jgi:hypothetical protein